MGHQRLGKLPTHRYLPDIVRYLVTGGAPTAPLVEQVTEVSRDALKRALREPVFVEALWLLIRLPQAAASKDFGAALADIGMGARPPTSVTELMVAYNNALERVQRRAHAGATDLGDIARQAGVAALAEAVEAGMPMWSPTAADVQASVAALRSPEKFGALAHHFHANIVERVIHYYVDRNLHKPIGADRVARSVHDLAMYNSAIRRHCIEAALIMRAFAKDWLGKNQYRDGKDISRDDARRFSAFAVEKIGNELKNRRGANVKRCLIECGVPQASEADALAMNVSEPGKNVNLRIDYISRSMIGNIPDLLIDLLEVAAYVYCADQRIARGSAMLTNFGEDWRRSLTFSIPVRHPEVWQSAEVQERLLDTPGFLSDDSYAFNFRKAEAPVQPRELYFPELLDAFQENDEVGSSRAASILSLVQSMTS